MDQLIHQRGKGLFLKDVPLPEPGPGQLLVQTRYSLLSPGTERYKLAPPKSALAKIKEKPELIGKGVKAIRERGLKSTLEMTRRTLEKPPSVPSPMGYSSAGIVIATGSPSTLFPPGTPVACAGAGFATHADFNVVPENLCVPVPEGVGLDDAASATLGAIALQGVRQTDPTLGETVAVIGLGLIGQMTVQLLKANGCRVIGSDLDPLRVEQALALGADLCVTEGIVDVAGEFTRGRGVDAVIITASTPSDEPLRIAGEISRLKGRIVVVGLVGMTVQRDIFYEKELDLRLSMSYGPGRYDPDYELRGRDYPFAYVRWTEQRNMEAYLQLVADGSVTPGKMITHRFPIAEAAKAYELLEGGEPSLGIVLAYPEEPDTTKTQVLREGVEYRTDEPALGLVGAGNFAQKYIFPRLKSRGLSVVGVATARGMSARSTADYFGAAQAGTDYRALVTDERVNTVFIVTRHNQHPEQVAAALAAGKHVFVEKPLAIDEPGLELVREAASSASTQLMVGFNRRFSPHAASIKKHFAGAGPLSMIYRVNAGMPPMGSWYQNPEEGGGRIIGEVCHFVDFLGHLCEARPVRVFARTARLGRADTPDHDHLSAVIEFADGSLGTIHYFAGGAELLTKEYVEVHGGGRSATLDDFQSLTLVDEIRSRTEKGKQQDKGYDGEIDAFLASVRSGEPAIPFAELDRTTRVTFAIADSLRLGRDMEVD